MRVLATAAGSFSLAVFAANCIPLLEGALLPLSCALAALCAVLENDPRPSYQNSEERIYGLSFAGMEIKFQVKDQVLHVVGAERAGT